MKKYFYIGLSIVLLLGACKCDKEFEGPALANIFGDFTVLEDFEITNTTPDFSSGENTVFKATFSKQVDWEVRVVGMESGAVKSITGFSSDLNTTNAKWEGTTTEIPLFQQETCAVHLLVVAEEFEIESQLEIQGTRQPIGLVVADFESGFNGNWDTFIQSGADMSFNITDDQVSAQGSMYYDMGGEVDWDWLIGLIEFPADALGAPTYDLPTVPGSVFFNVMINVPEGIFNEVILFQFREDDNTDDFYTENAEDMFSLELKGLDPGWQLISVRYDQLETLVNGAPANPIGNGIYEPQKLQRVSVLFLADPASGYSQTLMDYLIFTENGPLIP